MPASPRALTISCIFAGIGVYAAAAWYDFTRLGGAGVGIVLLFWIFGYGIRLFEQTEDINGCRSGECPHCKHLNRLMPWSGYGT